ncbi:hypothetical protein OIU84_026656 [Salix udensis]|uniref:Uncharacterized protein n=1 Tax=Salix udensis TaxID=889485 RepID=A0AAD6KMC8_9ROSI|nr:hypothetical protein OIU84_026656 [Salix udensis]
MRLSNLLLVVAMGVALIFLFRVTVQKEVLNYIADECPALISLSLPADRILSSEYSLLILPTVIGKWEHLENLWLESSDCLVYIITEIALACSKFSGLSVSSATIGEEQASAIVTYLPNIKSLILRGARMDLKNLVIILQGCKNLVHLDVRDCRGFISGDERVLELASNIKTFMCEGSMVDDYDDGDHYIIHDFIDNLYGYDLTLTTILTLTTTMEYFMTTLFMITFLLEVGVQLCGGCCLSA